MFAILVDIVENDLKNKIIHALSLFYVQSSFHNTT
jgi:hypothetical protein